MASLFPSLETTELDADDFRDLSRDYAHFQKLRHQTPEASYYLAYKGETRVLVKSQWNDDGALWGRKLVQDRVVLEYSDRGRFISIFPNSVRVQNDLLLLDCLESHRRFVERVHDRPQSPFVEELVDRQVELMKLRRRGDTGYRDVLIRRTINSVYGLIKYL